MTLIEKIEKKNWQAGKGNANERRSHATNKDGNLSHYHLFPLDGADRRARGISIQKGKNNGSYIRTLNKLQ
jgi:hypothetical protein